MGLIYLVNDTDEVFSEEVENIYLIASFFFFFCPAGTKRPQRCNHGISASDMLLEENQQDGRE